MRFSGSCARCAAYNGLCNRPTDKVDLIKYIRCGEEAEPLSAGKDRMEPDKYFVKYAFGYFIIPTSENEMEKIVKF